MVETQTTTMLDRRGVLARLGTIPVATTLAVIAKGSARAAAASELSGLIAEWARLDEALMAAHKHLAGLIALAEPHLPPWPAELTYTFNKTQTLPETWDVLASHEAMDIAVYEGDPNGHVRRRYAAKRSRLAQWEADREAVRDRFGCGDARSIVFEAQGALEANERAILAFEPRSIADVLAKIAWGREAGYWNEREPGNELDLEPETILAVVTRDLERITGEGRA